MSAPGESTRTVRWLTRRSVDVPPADDWLAPSESAVLAGLRFAKRRDEWRLGRWTAKLAVAAFREPLADLRRVEVLASESGAPEAFLDGRPAAIALSLSHSSGRAVCAVAAPTVALGCDVELVEERSAAFLSDYFTAEEQSLVMSLGRERRPLAGTLLWSAKESALKALRVGLRRDTRSVPVRLGAGDPVRGWQRLAVRDAESGVDLRGLWRAEGGFVLTLVTDLADPAAVRV